MCFAEKKKIVEEVFLTYMGEETPVTYLPEYDPHSDPGSVDNAWKGIRALAYEGVALDGKKTTVFAYIGFPKEADAAHKVPAMVLVHGGGGHAFAEWVKMWNDRGYAAIAMDNTGFFPSGQGKGIAGRELDDKALWQHGAPAELETAGYVGIPDNDGMAYADGPLDRQWMYHAVISTIGAHNILLADERVDTTRVGITGVSWGGVITSIAIGYDTRYAFAIPIYGSGYLDEAHTWMKPMFGPEPARALWSAAHRFDRVQMPVFWLCWCSDTAFSVNSNSRSYLDTRKAGGVLSMRLQFGHSHARAWTPPESYIFADSMVLGTAPMTLVVTEPAGRDVRFTVQADPTAQSITARIVYITEELSYSVKGEDTKATVDQEWKTVDCTVQGDTVVGTLPEEAVRYFVELVTKSPRGEYTVTTAFN